jgi:DNA-binding transcriptional regulator YdaS (Cro superfamily)
MTALLHLVPPSPSLDARLAANFAREEALVAELAQVRAEINADRALWMARHKTFGISREALRKAVRG